MVAQPDELAVDLPPVRRRRACVDGRVHESARLASKILVTAQPTPLGQMEGRWTGPPRDSPYHGPQSSPGSPRPNEQPLNLDLARLTDVLVEETAGGEPAIAPKAHGWSYVKRLLRDCALGTLIQLGLGYLLKRLLAHKAQFKGWPFFTYIHSLVHTGLLLPAFLLYFVKTVKKPSSWLGAAPPLDQSPLGRWDQSSLGAEQWVQTLNIGYQIAATLLSFKKIMRSPDLLVHHIVTIGGCAAWLHPAHGAGYGALFTAVTEGGSTVHHLMALHNTTSMRWLRVATDILTRGFGAALLSYEGMTHARAQGLPAYLQAWTFVGGSAWFCVNASWTVRILRNLLQPRNGPLGDPWRGS